MARIVVIGAGLGGMAVAARLAVKRHDVTLVETSTTPGGQVRAVERDGCTFELGPTALTLPAVYRDLFLKTGGPLEDEVELVPLEPAAHYHFADGTHLELPGAGVGATAAAVGEALGPASAAEWQEVMAHAAATWALVRGGLTGPAPRTAAALDALLNPTDPGRRPPTLQDLLTRSLTDPRARAVMADRSLPLPMDPRSATAAAVLGPYLAATFGAWHIRGGMHRLAQALHDRVCQREVRVLLGTRALRIELAAGRVTGVVVTDGATTSRLPADVVVADLPSTSAVWGLLPPDAAPPGTASPHPPPRSAPRPARLVGRTAPALRRTGPPAPPGRLTLMLSTWGPPPLGPAWEHVWLPVDPARRSSRHARIADAPDPDPVIRAHVPADPQMHPAGLQAWTVHVDVSPHSPGGRQPATMDWDAPGVATKQADRVLRLLADRGTDLSGRIRHREIHTPADQERATGMPGGALLGEPLTADALRRRPSNVTAIPGLFLVGAATHPGPGLAMVGLSAEIVAQVIGRA